MDKLHEKSSFDFALFFGVIALWTIGILLVYSATHLNETGPLANMAQRQLVWVVMGIAIMLLMVSIPTRFYFSFAYIVYGISCLLLLYADFTGIESKGASRWIGIGGYKLLQPSEFAKIGLLFALARHLSEKSLSLERITSFIVPCILIIVPFGLVIKQPDLATAMTFCGMSLPLFFWAGLPLREVFLLVSPGISLFLSGIPLILSYISHSPTGVAHTVPWGIYFLVLIGTLYFLRPNLFIWIGVLGANIFTAFMTTLVWNNFLKNYQKDRIISFINPQSDPFGAGYQVIQSKVAIGSGEVLGKGYLQGTQTRLSFLPEQHTDFIFSVLGEQFGLIGCTSVLLLLLFVIVRMILTTQRIRNRFTNLLIVGGASILGFHMVLNTAMTLGMVPVAGVPLPFLSYGGSFTLTIAMILGLALNARVQRQDF